MTAAGEILLGEIRRGGPIPFRRFMEVALYHPECGYYRRRMAGGGDPFGKDGDFFTAEQLQPVFGILIAARLRLLRERLGGEGEFTVVELGAGREEMAEALAGFRYVPVDVDRGALPPRFTGAAFANEFFDALPVDAVRCLEGVYRLMRVSFDEDRFTWVAGERVDALAEAYLEEAAGAPEEGCWREVCLDAIEWVDRIAASLERGWLFAIDYGYRAREAARFPQGTLMSYRRHRALEDVLAEPGERDLTAHVAFGALEAQLRRRGFTIERRERLALTLLDAGERDQFAAALDAPDEARRRKRQLQLKTLLYGMGETFLTLLAGKGTAGGTA